MEIKTLRYRESEFSMENQLACRSELPIIDIINMTLKKKITSLKNLIEMRQITLNDPNFDIKKSLDTLIVMNKLNDGSSGKLLFNLVQL